MVDRLSWQKHSQGIEEFQDGLITALVHSGVCLTLQDREQNFLFIANLPSFWVANIGEEPNDKAIFGEELGSVIISLKKQAIETGRTEKFETSLGDHGDYQIVIDPIMSRDKNFQIITTIIDMSEERQREKMLKALLREVSHRSKNMLAIVLSLASQTKRQARTLDDFMRAYSGKVYSLSASQDLVTDSNWRGAKLFDLVRSQAEKYFIDPNVINTKGENYVLNPNAALHVGLALHELIVGLLAQNSDMAGQNLVQLSCHFEETPKGHKIEIEWLEDKAKRTELDVMLSDASNVMLEQIVPSAVSGAAYFEEDANHFSYRIVWEEDKI